MDTWVIENVKSKIQHYEKTKSNNNGNRGRRNTGPQEYFQQNCRRKFPYPKTPIKVKEAYRTPNRLDKKRKPLGT